MSKSNILLIGMPATGKSTLGRLLAKELNKSFVDTDDSISDLVGMPIQEALDNFGNKGFGEKENEVLLAVDQSNLIISTGGSAIYQSDAIEYLKLNAITVHLYAEKSTLLKRIQNFSTRALVIEEGMTFEELFEERMPLYVAAADINVSTDGQSGDIRKSLASIIEKVQSHPDYA